MALFFKRLLSLAMVFLFTTPCLLSCGFVHADELPAEVSASGSTAETSPAGALDGDRFSVKTEALWKGEGRQCWWQVTFPEPRQIGSILQINGDHEYRLDHAPRNYRWLTSADGETWTTISEAVIQHEKRLYRIHRLQKPISTRYLRLQINQSYSDDPAIREYGQAAALREVEFYPTTNAEIDFEDWIIAVSSVEAPDYYGAGPPFISLARECEGWENVPAQWLWHGDFDLDFVSTEPRPLCAFFSGSGLEWCQRSREPWRGVQEVLESRALPMWGACGGAQAFAILEETGVDRPWDCPRCRDPENPLSPVYSHIGHTGHASCGDYSQNVPERGLFTMRKVADDPVFKGLTLFEIAEGHIGQIDYVPEGWTRVVTKGPGALTVNQCLRISDAPIYAAQFHCESYSKTREASKQIMSNFLQLAQRWGGYNPDAKRLALPEPMDHDSDTPADSPD